jgi:hypothetical protein
MFCHWKHLSTFLRKVFSVLSYDVPLVIGEKRVVHGGRCSITLHHAPSRQLEKHWTTHTVPGGTSLALNSTFSACEHLNFGKKKKKKKIGLQFAVDHFPVSCS